MSELELKQKLLDTNLVTDCEFLDKYCKLLIYNSLDNYDSRIANYHHAIPRMYFIENNLKIDDSSTNLFILLYKDHVLAHYYLAMAAATQQFKLKMFYAVRFVIGQVKDITEAELLLKLPEAQASYEAIAKDFSENNPSKNLINAKRISQARLGKVYIRKDGISKVIAKDELDTYLANGWERGRVGKWKSTNKGLICVTFNNRCKYIPKEVLADYLAKGAVIGGGHHTIKNKGNMGKMSAAARKSMADKRRGKIAIHRIHDGKILYINKEELDSYLQNDWALGTGLVTIHKDNIEKHVPEVVLEQYLADSWLLGK